VLREDSVVIHLVGHLLVTRHGCSYDLATMQPEEFVTGMQRAVLVSSHSLSSTAPDIAFDTWTKMAHEGWACIGCQGSSYGQMVAMV
jgi:hypothetical protein